MGGGHVLAAVNVLSEVASALSAHNASPCPSYITTVECANRTVPPPYIDEQYAADYQRQACDPFWLSSCLIANAAKEADGARQLSVFAGRIPSDKSHIADAIIRHATDEAKHARVFLQLLNAVFPEAEISDRLRSDLQAHLPSPPMTVVVSDRTSYTVEQMIDEISQINIGEIRTRINQLILRPMLLAHAPAEKKIRVRHIIDNLLRDEQKHIAYTGEILENFSRSRYTAFFDHIYVHRFGRFNERTVRELGGGSSVEL
jgi:hypothetical protein